MQKFGYGEKFIYMIKVEYTKIQSKIKINGLLSDTFTLMRAVCQGCPISILLYITVVEVLFSFKGMQIGDREIKLITFSKDNTIYLRDYTCLNRIQLILKLFGEASSSRINISKSQAVWVEVYKNRTDKPGQMALSNISIKIFGVNFGNYALNNSNWDKISEILTNKIPYLEQSENLFES